MKKLIHLLNLYCFRACPLAALGVGLLRASLPLRQSLRLASSIEIKNSAFGASQKECLISADFLAYFFYKKEVRKNSLGFGQCRAAPALAPVGLRIPHALYFLWRNKYKKFFFTKAILLFLASCEDPIQIKLDQGQKLLVIDAFINDLRQDQKVRVTYSQNYFDNPASAIPVPDAQVFLKDLTAYKTYTFTHTNNGIYKYTLSTTDTMAYTNHLYRLEVLYKGVIYTATTLQKRTAVIDSIQVKYEKNNFSGKEGYKCILWGRDVPGPVPDFYWIKSFKNGKFFGKTSQINLAYDGASGGSGGIRADGYVFTPNIAENITPFGEYFQLNDTCKVEIHSISQECWNMFNQIITNTNNQGLFATTLENTKTNIQTPPNAPLNAVGFFNMATVITATKIVK